MNLIPSILAKFIINFKKNKNYSTKIEKYLINISIRRKNSLKRKKTLNNRKKLKK